MLSANVSRALLVYGGSFGFLALAGASGCGEDPAASQQNDNVVVSCSDENCAAGTRCDPLGGCVECLFDVDCDEGEWCEQRQCTAVVPCASSADCSGDADHPACDDTLERCVRCVDDIDCAGEGRCVERQCEPAIGCNNSFDCSDGTVCDRTHGVCVECVGNGDCTSAHVCFGERCLPSCDSDNDCESRGEHCDPRAGACVQCVEHTDCPREYHCKRGACSLDLCDASSSTCSGLGTGLVECSAQGDAVTLVACEPETSCMDTGGYGTCEPWTCDPGDRSCSEEIGVILECAADGLTLVPVETCAEDEACTLGRCVPQTCSPGESLCVGMDVATCSDDGARIESTTPCPDLQTCYPASGACEPIACLPGLGMCDGDVLKRCNDVGTDATEVIQDCAASDAICWEGQCWPIICTPGEEFCDNGFALLCNDNAASYTVLEQCSSSPRETCVVSNGAATCEPHVCEANFIICNGDVIGTCNSTGTGYTSEIDCAAQGATCIGAACIPVICEPDARYCSANTVQICDPTGTQTYLVDACQLSQYCNDSGAVTQCAYDVCTAGSPICRNDFATTCNADGSGPEPTGGTDCTATSQVCSNGACIDP